VELLPRFTIFSAAKRKKGGTNILQTTPDEASSHLIYGIVDQSCGKKREKKKVERLLADYLFGRWLGGVGCVRQKKGKKKRKAVESKQTYLEPF